MGAEILRIPISESYVRNPSVSDGWYVFEVEDYRPTISKKGEPAIVFKGILDNNIKFTVPFVLTSQGKGRLCEFLNACGAKTRGVPILLEDAVKNSIGKKLLVMIVDNIPLKFIDIREEEDVNMFIDYYQYFLSSKIEKGNRNNMLFRATLAALSSNRDIEPLIKRAIELGLPEKEVEMTIKSAYKIDINKRNVYRAWYQPIAFSDYISELKSFNTSEMRKQFEEQIKRMFYPGELVFIASINDNTKDFKYEVLSYEELMDLEYIIPEDAIVMANPVSTREATGKVEDVKSYRYVVVESDTMPVESQYEFWKNTELPVDLVIYSGNKSLHALVRINGINYEDYLYKTEVIKKYLTNKGFPFDKNLLLPNAKCRLAGSYRNCVPQAITLENVGLTTEEFFNRYGEHSKLPKIISLSDLIHKVRSSTPPPTLIEGILRHGSTMIIAGEPKVGKTMLLLHLACAFSSGGKWLNRDVKKSKVLFINMEVDEFTIVDRLEKVMCLYDNVDANLLYFLHLRGHELGFEDLFKYIVTNVDSIGGVDVVIVDPIYKLFDGDENSAKEVSKLVTLIDRHFISNDITFIFSHHFKKVVKGNIYNRISGSGVFMRYPEAIMYVYRSSDNTIKIDYLLRSFDAPLTETYKLEFPVYVKL